MIRFKLFFLAVFLVFNLSCCVGDDHHQSRVNDVNENIENASKKNDSCFKVLINSFALDTMISSKLMLNKNKSLFYETIDSVKVNKIYSEGSLTIFVFKTISDASASFSAIKKRAVIIVNEKPQQFGKIGTFSKSGSSYLLFNNFLVHRLFTCTDKKSDLDDDEIIFAAIKKFVPDSKYIRLECGYKNLVIK